MVTIRECDVFFKGVRAEGEDVKAMLQRLLWDLAGAY